MFRISSSRDVVPRVDTGEIIKQGYLKKLKTMRKKYFVLRGDSAEASARLEYYESEKKWKTSTCSPKRTIVLKNCFNINKRTDTRHKWVIALYTRNDKFCIVFDNEEEMEEWLHALLALQQGEVEEGGQVRPIFEHVWEVWVHEKELGSKTNITGPCRLCLTDQAVTLVRREKDETAPETSLEYSLQKIRCCGHMETFFYMEVGQWTATGAGNLWLQAEDTNIAENIYLTIMKYLENCGKSSNKESQFKSRDRSVSVNESSKPTSMTRWPTHSASSGCGGGVANHQRTYSFPLSPLPPARRASTGTRPLSKLIISTSPQSSLITRERADSMPSRARTTSECVSHLPHPPRHPNNFHRPHSTYNRNISYSPPAASSPVSPGSGACSTDSAGSSLSMDGDVPDGHWEDRYSHSLTPDEPVIVEENSDEYAPWIGEDEQLNNYVRNTESSVYAPHPITHSCHNSTNSLQTTNFSPSQTTRAEANSAASNNSSYMIMSPGSLTTKTNQKVGISHSRGSSLTEDGYVPMAPGNSDDGYVEMDHGSSRHKEQYRSGELSTGSSCSFTSGTPSTDMRLDKVRSYFTNEDIAERPTRAYSLGSRPTFNKNRTEIPVTSSNERTRAFSVGSKNVKLFNTLRTHNHHHTSSHSSMEPCDDMMEMDFSKKGRMKNRKKLSSSERLSVPIGSASTLSSAASSYSTAEGSYMEMSPRCSPSLAPSPPKSNRLFILGKSPPKHDLFPFTRNSPPVSGYPSPSLGRVPELEPMHNEGGKSPPHDNPYMEMKPKSIEPSQRVISVKNTKARIESFPSSVVSPHSARSKNRDDLESSLKRKMSHPCSILEDNNNSKISIGGSSLPGPLDEYVEMDLGASKGLIQSLKNPNEDYMEMDGTGDKLEKGRSQPIAIQSSVKDSSHNSVFAFVGRKNSTGTSPKPSFLQFDSSPSPVSSPYGTMGRQRSRKSTVRRDSKETLGGGASSGSSTSIFPMSLNSSVNSPDEYEPKCPVDASSGTVILSSEHSRSVDDLTTKVQNCAVEDDIEEYVLYDPGSTTLETSDYAEMAPVKPNLPPVRKTSAPLLSFNKNLGRFLSGLGVGQMSTSVSSPSIKTACQESTSPIAVKTPSFPEEEEEDYAPIVDTTQEDRTLSNSPVPLKEKELHYASLDLARSGSESEESNKTLKTQTSLTESSSASSPSPNPTEGSSSFTYAEIDFAKSGSSQNQ